MLKVEEFVVRAIMTNCYLIYCDIGTAGVVIDPGDISQPLLDRIKELKINVKYIINTHGHIDHIEGNEWLRKETMAPVVAHYLDRNLYEHPRLNMSILTKPNVIRKPDIWVKGGESIGFGKCGLKVIHTPGHTPGCISLMGDGKLFTGDTLFEGSIGRTDFPGGSYDEMMCSLREKILPLDDNLIVLPGHGPKSMLQIEKETNPYLASCQS